MGEHRVVQSELMTHVLFGAKLHELPSDITTIYNTRDSRSGGYFAQPGDSEAFATLVTALFDDPACDVRSIWVRGDGGLNIFHNAEVITDEVVAAVRRHVEAIPT